MKEITVFTPVYNRAQKLQNLYKSLLKQSNKSFIWIIIDDGSTDKTCDVINSIVSEKKLQVVIGWQHNQGKHVAHNKGVEMCETKLFVCVDSDDTLIPTAIADVLNFANTNQKMLLSKNICGIIAWKGFNEKEKIGNKPITLEVNSLIDLYKKHGMSGDTMLVFKTEIIRKYPFPQFKEEKFLRESIVYNKIDLMYKYIILDKILYIAEYCEDGLSRNASKLELSSPKGAALFRYEEYKYSSDFKASMRNLVAYVFFNHLGKNNTQSIQKLGALFFLLWPISMIGYFYYRKNR